MPLLSIKSPWNRYGLGEVAQNEQKKIDKETTHEIGVKNKVSA